MDQECYQVSPGPDATSNVAGDRVRFSLGHSAAVAGRQDEDTAEVAPHVTFTTLQSPPLVDTATHLVVYTVASDTW